MKSDIKIMRIKLLVVVLLCLASFIVSFFIKCKIESYNEAITEKQELNLRRKNLAEKNQVKNRNIDQVELFRNLSEMNSVTKVSINSVDGKYEVELKGSMENFETFINDLTKISMNFGIDKIHYTRDKVSVYFSIL